MIPSYREYRLEHICNVIRANDAPVTPNLNYFGEVDTPSVFLVGLVDYVDALNKGCEEGGVDRFAEVL
jgi:hypothetical protein